MKPRRQLKQAIDPKWAGPLGGLLIAVLAGSLCAWLHTPLPWMIGPLFAVAGARLAGVEVTALPGARYAGQWIIGSALGLYFTPTVVRQVVSFARHGWCWPVSTRWAVDCSAASRWPGWRTSIAERRSSPVFQGATEMSVLAE